MGCYLAPDDTSTNERVIEAIREQPKGAELLVAGDFIINLAAPEGYQRGEAIATTMATEGLEDMAPHSLLQQRRQCWDWRGGVVLDRLYPGNGPPSLWKYLRPGPLEKLGPLHGPGLPAKRLPEKTQAASRGRQAVAGEAVNEDDTGGQTFHGPMGGRSEGATVRGYTERLDFGGDVEAC